MDHFISQTTPLTPSLMRPGENCWRLCQADEAGFLIDAEAYFRSIYLNLQRARHSIYILGWDIDSRISLLKGESSGVHPSPRLDELFATLLSERPHLNIHILTWDFSPIFTFDRELFQSLKFRLSADRRLHFHFDSQHPFTASQHQKIVVVDDRIAWCGGLDLTDARWDTDKHAAHDQRRRLVGGKPYPPHHDVQMAVTGEVASALGDIFRDRWFFATGERLRNPPPVARETYILPEDGFTDVTVGVARTYPAFQGEREVREVEKLYVDAIRAAKHFIYLENQYFTADAIAMALAESLQKPTGPEIIVILPIDQVGFLAKIAMRNLSLKIAHKLTAVDRHHRFHVYSPIDENLTKPWFRNIHSKVAIFDFTYARVGSANLNNRSMGLDSECDLMIDATGSYENQAKIMRFLAALISEHVPLSREELIGHIRQGTLVTAIEAQKQGNEHGVYLLPHVQKDPGLVSNVVQKIELFDPKKSTKLERLLDRVFFSLTQGHRPIVRNIPSGFSLTLLYCLVLAVLVVFRPIQPTVPEFVNHLPFWLLLGALFTIFPPLNFVIVTLASLLPFLTAVKVGMIWSTVAACLGYVLGRLFPRRQVQKLCKTSVHLLTQRIARYRVVDIFLLRFFPLSPFASLNLAAGTLRLSFGRYLLGTILGVLPGVLALTSFQRTLIHAARQPTLTNLLLFFALLAAIAFLYERLQNRFINSPKDRHEGHA